MALSVKKDSRKCKAGESITNIWVEAHAVHKSQSSRRNANQALRKSSEKSLASGFWILSQIHLISDWFGTFCWGINVLHEWILSRSRPGDVTNGSARHGSRGGVETQRESQNHRQRPNTDNHHFSSRGWQTRLQRVNYGHVPAKRVRIGLWVTGRGL